MTIVFAAVAVILVMQFLYFAYLSDMVANQNREYVENLIVRIDNRIEEQINAARYMQNDIQKDSNIKSFLREKDELAKEDIIKEVKRDIKNLESSQRESLSAVIIENDGSIHSIFNETSDKEIEKILRNKTQESQENNEYIRLFSIDNDPYNRLYICIYRPIKLYNTKVVGLDCIGTSVVMAKMNMQKEALENNYAGGLRFLLTSIEEGDSTIKFEIDFEEDKKFLSAKKQITGTTWMIKADAALNTNSDLNRQQTVIIAEVIIIVLLMFIMQRLLYKNIAKPAEAILKFLGQYSLKGHGQRLEHLKSAEFDEISMHINEMLDNLENMTRNIVATQQKLYETEISENKAVIYALQSQINPHFLYNTLDCMGAMALLSNQDNIYNMCMGISDILRYSIQKDTGVTLEDEIAITEEYISIQQIRFNNGFDVEIDIEDELWGVKIPRMCIQPVVENSFKHGMMDSEYEWMIRIHGRCENDVVRISVKDNGGGMEHKKYMLLVNQLNNNFGNYLNSDEKGLINIDKRIKLTYGEEYGITINQEQGKFMEVTINLPFENESKRD